MISHATYMKHLINCYPPYWGTGIVVKSIAKDFSNISVEMKMHWYNRNYVRTHFGGSLYAMTDPFYMLMLIRILGKGYIVWDKMARVEFVKPGTGKVKTLFTISDEQVAEIKTLASSGERILYDLPIDVKSDSGEVVARVIKTLYIRKKK